jgi:DNA-binding response OmpR family regulator
MPDDTRAPAAQTAAGATVLVIEDDVASAGPLPGLLEDAGLEVLSAQSTATGMRLLFERRPDLVLLDLGAASGDTVGALGRIRELSNVPVILATAEDDEATKVATLRAGADDYVVKPYGLREMVARAEVLLRRTMRADAPPGRYADGLVELDFGSLDVTIGGRPVELTALELRLLTAFVEHPGQVLSAGQLLERVWGDASLPRGRVKLYVAYLRDKFRAAGAESPIETVRGFGYRYRAPEGATSP